MVWEAPDPVKLLVTSRRVAEELDIPTWKANELCWSLGRIYVGGGGTFRVKRASLDLFRALLYEGLPFIAAREVMAREESRASIRRTLAATRAQDIIDRDFGGRTPRGAGGFVRRRRRRGF